jgi:hypothetical protein
MRLWVFLISDIADCHGPMVAVAIRDFQMHVSDFALPRNWYM